MPCHLLPLLHWVPVTLCSALCRLHGERFLLAFTRGLEIGNISDSAPFTTEGVGRAEMNEELLLLGLRYHLTSMFP